MATGAGLEKTVEVEGGSAESFAAGGGGTKTRGGLLKTGPGGGANCVGRVGGGEFGGVVDVLVSPAS